MNRNSTRRWLLAGVSPLCAMALALPAHAADAADKSAAAAETGPIVNSDDILVTATKVNQTAPITASVHTFEPQAIVSRSIIEDSLPATADFFDVAMLTPGASLTDNGGGMGLSESKLQLRGFQDGQYNITFDGIPFGDSNDPTHHSNSYFPDGTLERVIIDRGPGGATDLGQASYGGQVHLISREAQDKRFIEGQVDYGTWNTVLGRLTYNSGAIHALGDLKFIVVGEYKQSDTALTGSNNWFTNGYVKLEKPLGDRAQISFVSTYNQNFYHQSDNNGVSCYTTGSAPAASGSGAADGNSGKNCDAGTQVATYGKQYGLTEFNDGAFAGTHWAASRKDWNWTNKTTDFEILRLQLNFSDTVSLDDKAYTFFYKNFTVSAEDTTTPCSDTLQTACGGMSTISGTGPTTVGATNSGNIPGYTKVNQYRNWGDVLTLTFKTPAGVGKIGGWFEHSESHRYRYDYDFTRGFANGVIGDGHFDFGGMNNFFNYEETNKAFNKTLNGQAVPLYVKYDEYTSWDQIQGFAEFALKLMDDTLTITPGLKIQTFTRHINTPLASQTARVGIQASDSYSPTLPYFTFNYLIRPNLSVYGQFAKGFLIPSLANSLEAVIPAGGGTTCTTASNFKTPCNIQPTKTTNYQAGFVYSGERLNLDFDAYFIQASNSVSFDPSSGKPNPSSNPAEYQGLEGQVSYILAKGLTLFGNGAVMSSKDANTHFWLPQAPNYVGTLGATYKSDRIKFSYIHKFTGRQFADGLTAASSGAITGYGQQVRIAPYSGGILTAGYKLGPAWLNVSVDNLWNDTSTTKIGSPTKAVPLYFFQAPRSVMGDIKVRF